MKVDLETGVNYGSVLLLGLVAFGCSGAQADNSAVDLTRFIEGSLVSSEIVDCELADGTTTQCYKLVTVGTAKTSDMIGPFCPATTSTSGDNAGIWFDGTALYQSDGSFILNLPKLYGASIPPADQWIMYDADGNVNVTRTLEACQAAARPDVDPAYYGFCVECSLEDLDIDLSMTFTIPMTPQVASEPTRLSREAGVSLNGFQIAARAPVDDILSSYTIAAFDDCGGHVNPNDGYHYHAATGAEGCNSHGTDSNGHPALIGYALDGYGIYGPLAADSAEIANLDECNGNENSEHGYHYHAASPELNQHISCFHGKTIDTGRAGGPGQNRMPPGFEEAASSLGVTTEALMNAMRDAGGRNADLSKVASQLGVDESALRDALPKR